jgi:hypothetical protein
LPVRERRSGKEACTCPLCVPHLVVCSGELQRPKEGRKSSTHSRNCPVTSQKEGVGVTSAKRAKLDQAKSEGAKYHCLSLSLFRVRPPVPTRPRKNERTNKQTNTAKRERETETREKLAASGQESKNNSRRKRELASLSVWKKERSGSRRKRRRVHRGDGEAPGALS